MLTEPHAPLKIGTEQIELLEKLCNACAVSGDEGEVRKIVLEEVRPYAQEVKIDAMGNVLVRARSQASGEHRLRVLLAAHMDEIGFMLTGDEGDGFFRFDLVGGIDPRQLVAKAVQIGHQHIPGVIGAPPIHLASAEDLRHSMSTASLRIDVGPGNGRKVKVGDWATFAAPFVQLGPSLRAKALDDRLGVASLIQLVKHPPAHLDLLAAFTVQEEVGLRGGQVAAYAFDPDIAIALDATPAADLPAWDMSEDRPRENARYNTRLGLGPAIYLADGGTFSDPRLVRWLVDTAQTAGIPIQFRQPGGGRTDAGAMHLQRHGIPALSLSVPGRYMHTAASLIRLEDWENTLALISLALERLTPAVLTGQAA